MSKIYPGKIRDWKTMSPGGILNWFIGITYTRVEYVDKEWILGRTPLEDDTRLFMARQRDDSVFEITVGEMRRFLIERHGKAQYMELYDVHENYVK